MLFCVSGGESKRNFLLKFWALRLEIWVSSAALPKILIHNLRWSREVAERGKKSSLIAEQKRKSLLQNKIFDLSMTKTIMLNIMEKIVIYSKDSHRRFLLKVYDKNDHVKIFISRPRMIVAIDEFFY